MRRWLAALFILCVLSLVGIYLLIPGIIRISTTTYVNSNVDGAARILLQPANWKKWWTNDRLSPVPGFSIKNDAFVYKQNTYKITTLLHNAVEISINDKHDKHNSTFQIFPLNADSIAIRWKSTLTTGWNPFEKIKRYRQAVSIKKDMAKILSRLQSFLTRKENIYGINIQKTSTTDTLLVATKSVSPVYPTNEAIYNSVEILKKFISKKGALQTGAPMVNVTRVDSAKYEYMVAVPTNVPLQDEGNIFLRRMIRGSFLVTEVKGGMHAVNDAMNNMNNYIADYRKTPMAMPFQSLVTDRSRETDSANWVTKLYYPIFY